MTGRSGAGQIRVGLVDDDPLVRAGLRMILESDPLITVVLEHGDGLGVVPAVRGAGCDVVLMDVRMPGRSGLDAVDDLRAAAVDTRIIVLTTFTEVTYLRRAVESSVDGYVTKASAPEVLIAAVHSVQHGGAALSPVVARWLVEHAAGPMARQAEARAAVAQLTSRQQDVLLGIARGEGNAEIADRLHLSTATIKGYVSETLQRLGASRRVQAAVIAHQAGLV